MGMTGLRHSVIQVCLLKLRMNPLILLREAISLLQKIAVYASNTYLQLGRTDNLSYCEWTVWRIERVQAALGELGGGAQKA